MASSCLIQDRPETSVIAFYNLENLFDTLDAKGKNDNEYLPTSQKNWNTPKYEQKLNNLARVILGIGNWEGPDLIGLCEVENRDVLKDLISKTYLSRYDYEIIHQESPDNRGIDVAAIYKKNAFKVMSYDYYPVVLPGKEARPTRDILHIKGILRGTDTLHFFFNHWPSRWGGAARSMPKRMFAAKVLRAKLDSLYAVETHAEVVISGDFNDATHDASLIEGLKTNVSYDNLTEQELYNTSYKLQHDQKLGTHKYKEEWNLFDQFIVSGSLMEQEGFWVHPDSTFIYAPDWLQHEDATYFGEKPFRTWQGSSYLGGFSDHFGVKIHLTKE